MGILSEEEKIKLFPVICYSRVCGWMSPTANWNKGKKSEFGDRVEFVIDEKKLLDC